MIQYVTSFLDQFNTDEEGQGMVEYALILVLVSVVAILALTSVGGALSPIFNSIAGSLSIV